MKNTNHASILLMSHFMHDLFALKKDYDYNLLKFKDILFAL